MALASKLRKAGGSVALTIPRDFAAAMNLHIGNIVEIRAGRFAALGPSEVLERMKSLSHIRR